MCISIPNMKFLWLTLWQCEVCTDDDANTNGNSDDDDARRTRHDCMRLWLMNQMSQKLGFKSRTTHIQHIYNIFSRQCI